jgi:hypothetical protein
MGATVALSPRVRVMVICDAIRQSKVEADVFDLKGVRQSLMAQNFPFMPARLSLFLLLASPRAGVFPGYVRVVSDRTDRTIFQGNLYPRPEFDYHGGVRPMRAPIRCLFPEEGTYSVQVWFFQEQGSDVLKGEMPFTVFSENT